MRKFIFYLFLISLLIVSCSQDNKGYDALEKGLIGILEKKDEGYILQQLGKAAEQKNEDVFALAYVYLGTQGEEFYNKFLKKSNGYAEYYKAMFLKETNGMEEEIISLLESSAKQGNDKAYYMLGSIYESKFEFSKAREYLKKGKDAGEIYAIYSYNYNKNLSDVHNRIEELNKKLKDDTINQVEKKELGTLIVEKISNYENKVRSRIASYEAARDKVSDEYGWSPEETNANGRLNEKLDDELTKVYNLIMARLSESEKIEFRNKQRQWLKIRTKKVENSNNGEDGNPGMGGRAGANVEIMTYQEFTKDRLIEFAKIYDNMN